METGSTCAERIPQRKCKKRLICTALVRYTKTRIASEQWPVLRVLNLELFSLKPLHNVFSINIADILSLLFLQLSLEPAS